METIYNVPTRVAREIEEICEQLREVIDLEDAGDTRIAELEAEVEALEETLYQRNETISDLRNDIQLLSENKNGD